MLILEGAQAGLSWETILKRRQGYRKAFYHFDPTKVVSMTDKELEALPQNQEIIRNRLKIYATRQNAQIFLEIQREFGSFDRYAWGFVKGKPIKNHWKHFGEVPAKTAESDALSKDLKKQGMTFVGSTIMNLSRYSQNMLFESFPTSFRATSWPTYSSMSCEVALKSVKKSFKNQSFGISG